MAKKSVSPLVTWLFWSTLVLGAFLTVTWEYFIAGFSADSSKITWLILAFFIYGFGSSLMVAYYLEAEFKSIKLMDAEQRVAAANSSDAAAMFDAAMERVRRGERIDVRNLVMAYSAKLKSRIDNLSVVSGMLITIGLLGTVIGLIITISGLSTVLQSNIADFATMKEGLFTTVSGMGTAFYTTFFGALLGGVVLKVLASEMKKSAQVLVADAMRFSELYIAPQFQKKAAESLVEMEERIVVVKEGLASLGRSLSDIAKTIDSKQDALAAGFGALIETLAQANRQASKQAEAVSASLSGAIEASTRQADERLQVLVSSIEQSNVKTLEQSQALVAAIGRSIDSANGAADERLGIIANTIGNAMEESGRSVASRLEEVSGTIKTTVEETNRLADERLTALVERTGAALEESNRLADERLAGVLAAAEKASQASCENADAQLASYVDRVEKSVEKTRNDAEQRLNAKASDLAAKLNEAAGMISGLVQRVGDDRASGQSRAE